MTFIYIFLFVSLFFADFSGFVTSIWCAKSRSGNEYIHVKLKTGVCLYTTIRIMRKQNPSIQELILKILRREMYKFYNVATITIRTLCFNTFPGSKMEKGAAVSFKLKGNSNLPIKDI